MYLYQSSYIFFGDTYHFYNISIVTKTNGKQNPDLLEHELISEDLVMVKLKEVTFYWALIRYVIITVGFWGTNSYVFLLKDF